MNMFRSFFGFVALYCVQYCASTRAIGGMLSPRKQVPLASGSPSDRPRTRSFVSSDGSEPTKRAFYCSVVFEVTEKGHSLPPGMPSDTTTVSSK